MLWLPEGNPLCWFSVLRYFALIYGDLVAICAKIIDIRHRVRFAGRGVAGVRPRLEKPRPRLENIYKNAAGVEF